MPSTASASRSLRPSWTLALNGPKRRYLEREATYQLSVANPGTAPAKHVELVAYLPRGPEIRQRQQFRPLRRQHAGRLLANGRTAGQTSTAPWN